MTEEIRTRVSCGRLNAIGITFFFEKNKKMLLRYALAIVCLIGGPLPVLATAALSSKEPCGCAELGEKLEALRAEVMELKKTQRAAVGRGPISLVGEPMALSFFPGSSAIRHTLPTHPPAADPYMSHDGLQFAVGGPLSLFEVGGIRHSLPTHPPAADHAVGGAISICPGSSSDISHTLPANSFTCNMLVEG